MGLVVRALAWDEEATCSIPCSATDFLHDREQFALGLDSQRDLVCH